MIRRVWAQFSSVADQIRELARRGVVCVREWSLRFPYAKPLPSEGRDAQIIKLIVRLNQIKDIPAKELRTGSHTSITRITNLLRAFSALAFLVIVAAVGTVFFNLAGPTYPKLVALIADLVLLVLVGLWIFLDTAIPFSCLIFAWEYDFRIRQFELAHDLRMIAELREFNLDTLKAGEQWLGIKLERLKFRMIVIFGGSDKLALFALAGLAWALRKALQSNDPLLSQQWVTYLFAGLLGATLGGLLGNVVVRRLLYQRDILNLAMREREEREQRRSMLRSVPKRQ